MNVRATRPTWTEIDMLDQSGRTIVVTGGTGALGLRSACALAERGGKVLITARNPERGAAALEEVTACATGQRPELVQLDLGDLSSVRHAAADIRERTGDSVHALINNAGIMAPPLTLTVDGFESQWATNHLGHAALTWLLYPALTATQGARVVTVSSVTARFAKISPLRLDAQSRGADYNPQSAYSRSKLANLLFAFELHRRLRVDAPHVLSVAAHPGFAATNLANSMQRGPRSLTGRVTEFGIGLLGQTPRRGALPQLYAATAPGVLSGEYYGPSGLGQLRGAPELIGPSPVAQDERLAKVVWSLSGQQSGIVPAPSLIHPSGPSNRISHG
ncbi:oxidoreductase [Rhodococcus sp. X156]|uniref:oxidoreductase n=1 Tax=Rhodococcus sp. X156 TaxID=2499145 RepID=UPI000FDA005A|nr:oxidoreductase [Rhodococcus sp. X156]